MITYDKIKKASSQFVYGNIQTGKIISEHKTSDAANKARCARKHDNHQYSDGWNNWSRKDWESAHGLNREEMFEKIKAALGSHPMVTSIVMDEYEVFDHWNEKHPTIRIIGPGLMLIMDFGSAYSNSICQGHTQFNDQPVDRWNEHTKRLYYDLSFDRTGVDDSFSIDYTDDFIAILTRQFERITESRLRRSRSIQVPGLGYLITPEKKDLVSNMLQVGKSYTFTPSGFGVGKRLSKYINCYGRPAPKELAEFFGVHKLYIEDVDCD